MKKIKSIIPLLLISLVLTGCDVSDMSSVTSADSALANTSVEVSDNSALTQTSEPSTNEPLSRAELDKILNVFEEYAYLYIELHPDIDYSGRCCDYFPDCVDKTQFFTEEVTTPRGTVTDYYYKVVDGDYSTEDGFNSKLDEIFTEKFKEKYLENNACYRLKNGEIYVGTMNCLSYDAPTKLPIEITSERTDENTVIMTLTAYENPYTIKLIKGADGKYRIDEEDNVTEIARMFCFDNDLELVYGDITISRPSTWDTTITSEIKKLWFLTRFEQCLLFISDYRYINYMIDWDVDTSQGIGVDWTYYPFFKVVDRPLADEKCFLQKLGLIFTEKYKEAYLSDPNRKFTFKDGNVYAALYKSTHELFDIGNGRQLILNSVEYPDDVTILMTFTAVYDVPSNDFKPPYSESEYKVKFVKEGDFYKIDEINEDNAETDFARCISCYNTISYEDISVTIP